MKSVFISKFLEVAKERNTVDQEVHVFTQFFIHKQTSRNEELRHCLMTNFMNPHITKIHLLNERIYSTAEMGLEKIDSASIASRLVQHDTGGKRWTPQMAFQYIRERGLRGYFIFTNADIFFDNTIRFLSASRLHEVKQVLALLRYEYKGKRVTEDLAKCPLFGPRFDSQDTWIIHSNWTPKEHQERIFQYEFGKQGIDNKLIYLMRILGFDVVNDPVNIRTYHYHRSLSRDYVLGQELVPKPWAMLVPAGFNPLSIPPSLGVNMADVFKVTNGFKTCMFDDHVILYDYVYDKLNRGEAFVIPRIAGIENNMAVFCRIKRQTGANDFDAYFQQTLPAMKNNAGIFITSPDSLMSYSDLYLKAFENCDLFTGWDVQGDVFKHIAQSHEYIRAQVATNKQMLWAFALDVFHYVYDPKCWTKSLAGKRVLVISPFVDSIRGKIENRAALFDRVDLFPDCSFVFAKPPQTQGQQPSRDFMAEFMDFTKTLDSMRDDYDVALVSCGGYGNLVCNHLFEKHRKPAIYVGGVLQMYFGILGGRWLKERPDVLRLFMNSNWSRPKETERPAGCGQIENGCYW